jgi:hypothetical protein
MLLLEIRLAGLAVQVVAATSVLLEVVHLEAIHLLVVLALTPTLNIQVVVAVAQQQ